MALGCILSKEVCKAPITMCKLVFCVFAQGHINRNVSVVAIKPLRLYNNRTISFTSKLQHQKKTKTEMRRRLYLLFFLHYLSESIYVSARERVKRSYNQERKHTGKHEDLSCFTLLP